MPAVITNLNTFLASDSSWNDINDIYSSLSTIYDIVNNSHDYNDIADPILRGELQNGNLAQLGASAFYDEAIGLLADALVRNGVLSAGGFASAPVFESLAETAKTMLLVTANPIAAPQSIFDDVKSQVYSIDVQYIQLVASKNLNSQDLINAGLADLNIIQHYPALSNVALSDMGNRQQIMTSLSNENLFQSDLSGKSQIVNMLVQAAYYGSTGQIQAQAEEISNVKTYAQTLDNSRSPFAFLAAQFGSYSDFAKTAAATYGISY